MRSLINLYQEEFHFIICRQLQTNSLFFFFFFQVREDPTPYSSPFHKSDTSFENPIAGTEIEYNYHDDDQSSSGNIDFGTALYDFTPGGDDEVYRMTFSGVLFYSTMWTAA